MPSVMSPEYFTPAEVARRLRVSESTVLRMIAAGTIPAIRLSPRVYRIERGALDVVLQQKGASHAPT